MKSPELSLIIPAFNEAKNIRRTIEQTQAYLAECGMSYEIIVAADGDDGTREIVRDLGRTDARLKVIGDASRGGKGRGIRRGVALASGRIIGFADADYKTPIEEFDKILPWFAKGFDIVIGSRGMRDSRIMKSQAIYRRVGSSLFALGMHCVIGLWSIRDTQCGFKFFKNAVAKDIFARQVIDGYMFDIEVLYLAKKSGYRTKEVGVRWQDDGDSRLELVAGNWRNLKDVFKVRFGSRKRKAEDAVSPEASTQSSHRRAA